MGLKYYLNLLKDDKNIEKIKLRYFINAFLLVAYVVLFMAFFMLLEKDIISSSIFGLFAYVVLFAHLFLTKKFERTLETMMAQENLKPDDEVDSAFIAYRKGYADYNQKIKNLSKKLFILDLTMRIFFTPFMLVLIILQLTGQTAIAQTLIRIGSILGWAYLLLCILIGAFSAKKGVWYKEYSAEIDKIDQYKLQAIGTEIKFKIVADKTQNEQIDYIITDTALNRRYKKINKISVRISTILAIFVGLSIGIIPIIVAKSFPDNDGLAGSIVGWSFLFAIILAIGIGVIVSILQRRIFTKQYEIYGTNKEKHALNERLFNMRIPFMRRWNILFAICTVSALFSCIFLAAIVSYVFETDSFGVFFFFLFFVEFIYMFVAYFKAYGKLRQRMIAVEREIDAQPKPAQVEAVFDIDGTKLN